MSITRVQNEDFGEKIGGAKKDLWMKRGLSSDDLLGMNEREADKYTKKNYIWKKPDYLALIEGGRPVDVVYYIKTVRDSLETAPLYKRSDDTPDKRAGRKKQYIDTVRAVRDAVEGIICKEDVLATFDKFMLKIGFYEKLDPAAKDTTITDKLTRAMFIRSEWDYEQKLTRKAEKAQFGVEKGKKVPNGYEIKFNDGKHSWSSNNDWKPETFFIAKGRYIMQTNFETHEDALKWVQDAAQRKASGGKKRFIPGQLQNIVRDGADYRDGRDVAGDDYLRSFGFKGGEFGNWMSQIDRQASLNFGYDALKDLAAALKISDRDISYQGALSIAFGARGSGNAAAHYEPLRSVINLTKMNGAGSLAHEWWHGLDDFLGTKMGVGSFLSEKPSIYPLFKKLIDTIKYKPGAPELTGYYKASKKIGKIYKKDGGYWDSNTEITARAFAAYVLDKLPSRSDYLAGHAECAVALTSDKDGNPEEIRAFPQGEERKAINAVFDELFADLKSKKYLSPREMESCGASRLSLFPVSKKNVFVDSPAMGRYNADIGGFPLWTKLFLGTTTMFWTRAWTQLRKRYSPRTRRNPGPR